ncbi:MAG: L,D-transpeptidase [Labrys sp. (in: a-proteobacteria)]
MKRHLLAVSVALLIGASGAQAENRPDLGGGFIEFLFTGGTASADQAPRERPSFQPGGVPAQAARPDPSRPVFAAVATPQKPRVDPRFDRQVVAYDGPHKAGTIVIDTNERFLYLVQADGTAMRYGVGVGRPGFEWSGTKTITRKAEWPDWRPPAEMLRRRPDLPTFMEGGPKNPLGARALYLGSSLYRIHGSNEPHTIGQAVSSGCIRMRNEDVIDLYERVGVGTRVIVL